LLHFCFKLILVLPVSVALLAAEPELRVTRQVQTVHADPQSGKLVRSVAVTSRVVGERVIAEKVIAPRVVASGAPAVEPSPAAPDINDAVAQIAAEQSLPPGLIHSVIKVESNYNPFAVSNKGAFGLMQLVPATARRFGVSNVFNPVQNIQGGARYLRYLLDLYQGDYPLALAAYNAGEGAVAKYRGVPPYKETQNYLNLVHKQLERAGKTDPKVEPKLNQVAPAGPPRIRQIRETDGTVRYVSQ
jgi:soluble lytic murein transglycosylase-like protein